MTTLVGMEVEWSFYHSGMGFIPVVLGQKGNGNAFQLRQVGMRMHSENPQNGHRSGFSKTQLINNIFPIT